MPTRKTITAASWAIQKRELVETHMQKHRSIWDPASSEPQPRSESNVQVFVRVRPLLAKDLDQDAFSLALMQPPRTIHFTHPTLTWNGQRLGTKTYEADRVFGVEDGNETVWEEMRLSEGLQGIKDGSGGDLYIVAYGQTGTGKTYTTTALEEHITYSLFAESDASMRVCISAFEIRGANAHDLLSSPPFAPVKITGTTSPAAAYPGLSEHDVQSAPALLERVRTAGNLRTTRSTKMNDTSSRSHSVMRFKVTRGTSCSSVIVIDLAGSERARSASTNADPERRKEATEINKALATLKDCIRARISGEPHIPWRSNKLTMVLQGASAQSDTRLYVLACVSPSVLDCEDTLNTLNYITPFRLSGKDAVDAYVTSQKLGITGFTNPLEWSHEDSAAWITRNTSKFAPFLRRILPAPAGLATLIPLSVAELTAKLSTPVEGEPAPDSRELAQAKASVPTYHAKLLRLAATEFSKSRSGGANVQVLALGSTKDRALQKLTGQVPNAQETGFVTRIDLNGSQWQPSADCKCGWQPCRCGSSG